MVEPSARFVVPASMSKSDHYSGLARQSSGMGEMNGSLVRDIVGWDVGNWSQALRYWDAQIDWSARDRRYLEIGANKGGLSLWLALKGYQVICSDISDSKKRALPLHEKYGVESLVRYEDIDTTNIHHVDEFDVIVCKSVLGGLGNADGISKQAAAVAEMHQALKPGGRLLFAENLAATGLHSFLRQRFVGWGKTWKYLTLSEMNELLRPYSSFSLHTTGVVGLVGPTESARRLLSYLDRLILNRVVPANWRYVGYGIAIK